jgi:SPP1 gp7 family putative phage head morphogenesis protein
MTEAVRTRKQLDLTTSSGRIANALIRFSVKGNEIEAAFLASVSRRLRLIQSQIEGLIVSGALPANPRQAAEFIAADFQFRMLALGVELQASFEKLALSTGRALPRVLSRAIKSSDRDRFPRVEQLEPDPVGEDPFDEEEDEEDDDLILFFLGLTREELIRILTFWLWQGFTLSEQWVNFVAVQRQRLFQRLAGALGNALSSINDAFQQSVDAVRDALLREFRDVMGTGGGQLSGNSGRFNRGGNQTIDRASQILVGTQVQQLYGAITRNTLLANTSVFTGEVLLAVLDEVTCSVCRSLDGQYFPFEDGESTAPLTPIHASCRCKVVPVVRGDEAPSRVNWPDWFAQQDDAYQKKIMGPTRWEMWKDGKITFRDFVQFRNQVPFRIRRIDEL